MRMRPSSSIQRESFSEIDAPHLNIVTQRMRRAGAENPTFCNDIGAGCYAQRFPYVVVGNQDSDPACLEIEDDLLQFQHRNGINPAEGLIEQNEIRLNAHRTRNL